MKKFSGWEYLLIDVANNAWLDLDKQPFEARIQWATQHLDDLENIMPNDTWKEFPLYMKACMAIRDAQAGRPSGHMVGLDAVCSGMQIMSALTGCHKGAEATGLVNPNERSDAYTRCTSIMTGILGHGVAVKRKSVKNAVMTSLYGSIAEPKKEFGEDTPELEAFFKAMMELAPGACELLNDLLASWQPYALNHHWQLPDGFNAYVKVMARQEQRIEVDELAHSTFTYVHYENEGIKKDKKNAANVVHSVDAYILRTLIRRCNYDKERAQWAKDLIWAELMDRSIPTTRTLDPVGVEAKYYIAQYERSSIADITMLPFMEEEVVASMSKQHLMEIGEILNSMLEHEPFPVICIHDDFKAHPNNLNAMRKHYREILGDLADGDLLSDLFCQIHGLDHTPGSYPKVSNTLGPVIRQSNYALS